MESHCQLYSFQYVLTGDADYDKKMSELWGGPPPAWYEKSLEAWKAKYAVAEGEDKIALVPCSVVISFALF